MTLSLTTPKVRVIIESPFKGRDKFQLWSNIQYARLCVRDSILRGEAPIASHLLYTQPDILNDDIPAERTLGMGVVFSGLLWRNYVQSTRITGISSGMEAGIRAQEFGKEIVYQTFMKISSNALPKNLSPEESGVGL